MSLKTNSVTVSWRIYDSWSEILVGTRWLLDAVENQRDCKAVNANILRLTLVSSAQMIEVMLFSQIIKCVEYQTNSVKKLFDYDRKKKKISFYEAIRKWPEAITGQRIELNSEPMQSMDKLFNYRNSAIHHIAQCPVIVIGESAFHTAIESSKVIYNHFSLNSWDDSEYFKFADNNHAKTKMLLAKALEE